MSDLTSVELREVVAALALRLSDAEYIGGLNSSDLENLRGAYKKLRLRLCKEDSDVGTNESE